MFFFFFFFKHKPVLKRPMGSRQRKGMYGENNNIKRVQYRIIKIKIMHEYMNVNYLN